MMIVFCFAKLLEVFLVIWSIAVGCFLSLVRIPRDTNKLASVCFCTTFLSVSSDHKNMHKSRIIHIQIICDFMHLLFFNQGLCICVLWRKLQASKILYIK